MEEPFFMEDQFATRTFSESAGEKNMYGKKRMGIVRSTFLIGPDGTIRRVWKSVKVDGHDEAVVAALKELVATA
jgi:peroxiredoxin